MEMRFIDDVEPDRLEGHYQFLADSLVCGHASSVRL
jgi:hypothetical protein